MLVRSRCAVALAGAALLTSAPSAHAAERFVSPTGSGTACSAEQKCSLTTALFGNPTQTGDELILAPGEYQLGECKKVTRVFTIRGTDPAHRPLIDGPASPDANDCNAQKGHATLTLAAGTALQDIEVRAHGSIVEAIDAGGAQTALERVVVRNSAANGAALHLAAGALVRNSVAGNTIVQGAAGTVDLRNVTLVGANALGVFPDGGQSVTVNLVDSIARGDHDDLQFGPGATIRAGFSNFDPADVQNAGGTLDTTTFGHNQAAAPKFVADPVGFEPLFREDPASPTVDAGTADALPVTSGPFDLNGQTRAVNGAPDIGAHEFLPIPFAETGEATDITATSALLHGRFNPHGAQAGGGFQFGLEPGNSGQTRIIDIGAPGVDFVEGTLAITGLEPDTTYHYRALAGSISRGFSEGGDRTFKTLPAPATQVPGGPLPPPGGSGPPPLGLPVQPVVTQRCRVPNLIGRALGSAKKALAKVGCKLGKATKPRRRSKQLVVVAQSPRRGTLRTAGARVNVRLGPRRPARRRAGAAP